jgi:amino acid adenylation domain-containing protein
MKQAGLSAEHKKLFEALLQEAGIQPEPERGIRPRTSDSAVPLSFAQQGLWILDQLTGPNSIYNIPLAIRLKGDLNIEALERSLDVIVRRHESLRTVFILKDGQPRQSIVEPVAPFSLPIVNLDSLPESERESEAERLAQDEAERPFDLANGPLVRGSLLRLSAGDHVLMISMHHIISDGWSVGILVKELETAYEQLLSGKEPALPQLPIQYGDYALWQREHSESEWFQTELAYWRECLEKAPRLLELPADHPRQPRRRWRGSRLQLQLEPELTAALKQLSTKNGATLFMTLLAAFKIILYRYTDQENIVVGTPIAGRNRSEVEALIGFFINTLVLSTNMSANPGFIELLGRVRAVCLGAFSHQETPFERLVEEFQPQRNSAHPPLVQVLFNMQTYSLGTLRLGELKASDFLRHEVASKFDLTLYAYESESRVHFELVYDADQFEASRMVAFGEQLLGVLAQIVADPHRKIDSLSLVTTSALKVLPDPALSLRLPARPGALEIFAEQVERSPERVAIDDEQISWTYRELAAHSDAVAHLLLTGAVKPGEVVAIYAERNASLVGAILGVLKAGAAFLVVDPAYPALRTLEQLEAAQAGVLIELRETDPLFSQFAFRQRLRLWQESLPPVAPVLVPSPVPEDLAYVAFTSGSTGKPKVVMGTHGSLTHYPFWLKETFGCGENDRFSMLSGLAHDPLLRDIFTPLLLGATLCIPSAQTIATPGQLGQWMTAQKITFTNLTPAMGQLLTTTSQSIALHELRYAFFVGDKLRGQDISALKELAPLVKCVNLYGTTETQRSLSFYEAGPESAVLPIGKGIDGVQLLVMRNGQLAGISELGEIHVRSHHLARGYLNDPELTAQRFSPNPYTQDSSDRLYNTGDLGRYLPDGNVEIAGRRDEMVNIRGFRIELGEIESALRSFSGVEQCVVVNTGENLTAYLVGAAFSVDAAQKHLHQRLPDYMIPSAFVFLEKLPLTPNGKIDKAALPAPHRPSFEIKEIDSAPRSPIEETLSAIWCEALKVDEVGTTDNFFALGGHSLLAMQVLARVYEILHVQLSLRTFFEAPTIRQLALVVAEQQNEAEAPGTSAIRPALSLEEQLLSSVDELSEEKLDSLLIDMFVEDDR